MLGVIISPYHLAVNQHLFVSPLFFVSATLPLQNSPSSGMSLSCCSTVDIYMTVHVSQSKVRAVKSFPEHQHSGTRALQRLAEQEPEQDRVNPAASVSHTIL